MTALLDSMTNQLRVARRLAPRRGASLRERVGPLDDRFVFVVGSPRSGTTFLAGAIGSLHGFVDLGEVPSLKASIAELATTEPGEAARRLRRILRIARRVGLVGDVRPVEQTPEVAHVVRAVPLAFPEARIVHIVRDGRDVVSSLLEKPWLRPRDGTDDAGVRYGRYARFWVEPARREEFERVSEARRAAWAWRRYVEAVRTSGVPLLEVRYELVARTPADVAHEVGLHLDVSAEPLAAALGRAHAESVGRFRRDLDEEQLADVLEEAGALLEELGYA